MVIMPILQERQAVPSEKDGGAWDVWTDDRSATNERVLLDLLILNAHFIRDAGMAGAEVFAFSTTDDLPLD